MYEPMKMLKEFHDTFSVKQRNDSLLDKTDRRGNLIAEEYHEVSEALIHLDDSHLGMNSYSEREAMANLAKELADLLYVVYGTAEELGIPLEEIFIKVHESNMDKIWDDGTVHYRYDGKVLKPPTYKAPDIESIIYGSGTDIAD